MGILDEKRYADNMTRREVADALKNGHPLIAGYLVADAAKQMQENDALLKVLEQQSGMSQPGQSITDKLEAYLRNPDAAEQQKPGGPPGGPPRRPGPMPQGGPRGAGDPMPGPSGAGGPMPGPRIPGGAGGPMPGMLRGPQGAGAPMRRGGIVGYQEGGYADESDYGDFEDEDDPGFWEGTLDYAKEHPWKTAGNVALAASMFVPGAGLVAGGARAVPWALRGIRGLAKARQGKKGLAGLGQVVKTGAAGKSLTGRALARIFGGRSTSPAMSGSRGFTMPGHTGFTGRTLRDRWLGNPASEIGFSALGRRALGRGAMAIGGASALSTLADLSDEEIEALSAEEIQALNAGRRFPGGPGAGRSPSQDIFDQIETYRTTAGIPTEAEKNQNKLDADRAKELGDYRAGIAGLRPTDEQYRLRGRGVGFGALSKALARTGDPTERQDFGQIGESIRGETDRQLAERLGFEDKLAGIDTSIYGVESGSLGRQALLSRAGQAYEMPTLELMMQERRDAAAHRRAVEVANIQAGGRNQAMIARLYEALFSGVLSEEEKEMYLREIERLRGGASLGGLEKEMDRARSGRSGPPGSERIAVGGPEDAIGMDQTPSAADTYQMWLRGNNPQSVGMG